MIVLNVWQDNSDMIWLWCRLSIPDSEVGVGDGDGLGSNLDTQLARRSLVLTPSWWPWGIIRWLDLRGLTTPGGDNSIMELLEGDRVLGRNPGNEELRREREKVSSASSATIASNRLRVEAISLRPKALVSHYLSFSWRLPIPTLQSP